MYPACNACAPYYYLLPTRVHDSVIFFHIISWTAWYSEKRLLNIKCVFWFSAQHVFEIFLIIRRTKVKLKQFHYRPGQTLRVPGGWGSQISRQSANEGGKVVSPTYRLPLLPGNISGTHFCYRLSEPQGYSAAGRIMPIKNSNDTIGNRTRDLPTCSAMPQPTALPRTPKK